MNASVDTDRIERSILIQATRERVWRALTDAEQFGAWFGADLAGKSFKQGERTRGHFTSPSHADRFFDVVIERIEPQDRMAFFWHPYPVEPGIDYESEEPTLVSFHLEDAPGNAILLTVVESGFDKVPPQRRRKAFEMHSAGWDQQLQNVARHAGT